MNPAVTLVWEELKQFEKGRRPVFFSSKSQLGFLHEGHTQSLSAGHKVPIHPFQTTRPSACRSGKGRVGPPFVRIVVGAPTHIELLYSKNLYFITLHFSVPNLFFRLLYLRFVQSSKVIDSDSVLFQ